MANVLKVFLGAGGGEVFAFFNIKNVTQLRPGLARPGSEVFVDERKRFCSFNDKKSKQNNDYIYILHIEKYI